MKHLNTRWAILAGVVALAAAVSAASANITMSLDIRAYTDGRDLLVIQGDTMQWHHLDFAAVGRWGKDIDDSNAWANEPTILSTTLNGATVMNGYAWLPDWPGHPWPDEIRDEDSFSAVFSSLTPALPATDMTVDLTAIQARSELSIFQYPTAANGYTLILDFNDDDPSGADWYEAKVDINYVPEPATLSLLVLGGLATLGNRRRA
ncbi:MAG: PEP-CTERM sorting domain-containing protein [Phycisphaerae bacterium]|jgi:hypothetical protein